MKPDHDIEQVDYGYGYKGQNSPQQHTSIKVDGSSVAIGLSLLAIGGVLVAAIVLPHLIRSEAEKSGSESAVRSLIAEREARVAIDQVQTMRIELAKQKIFVQLDDHQ